MVRVLGKAFLSQYTGIACTLINDFCPLTSVYHDHVFSSVAVWPPVAGSRFSSNTNMHGKLVLKFLR